MEGFFFLIFKDIKPFLWAPKGINGPSDRVYRAYCVSWPWIY